MRGRSVVGWMGWQRRDRWRPLRRDLTEVHALELWPLGRERRQDTRESEIFENIIITKGLAPNLPGHKPL